MNAYNWFFKKNSRLHRPCRAFIWNANWSDGVIVIWGVDGKQAAREYKCFNKQAKPEALHSVGNLCKGGARFISRDCIHMIAFSSERPSIGMIAHESLHYVNFMLHMKGVRVSWGNDEVAAYALEHTVNNIVGIIYHGRFAK